MEKVKLPREVADAIEEIRQEASGKWTAFIPTDLLSRTFLDSADMDWDAVTTINRYINASIENMGTYWFAVKYGYEVEQTPEDKVRELYQFWDNHEGDSIYSGQTIASHISDVLNILNIKIEGVNA